MFCPIAHAAFGLIAAAGLFLAPSAAQAQYVQPGGVGLSFNTPGLSLGIGQPVYQPVPVPIAPVYPYAPAYGYYPRPIVPVAPYAPYYGGYRSGYYPNYGYNHNHNHGPNHGRRY